MGVKKKSSQNIIFSCISNDMHTTPHVFLSNYNFVVHKKLFILKVVSPQKIYQQWRYKSHYHQNEEIKSN